MHGFVLHFTGVQYCMVRRVPYRFSQCCAGPWTACVEVPARLRVGAPFWRGAGVAAGASRRAGPAGRGGASDIAQECGAELVNRSLGSARDVTIVFGHTF